MVGSTKIDSFKSAADFVKSMIYKIESSSHLFTHGVQACGKCGERFL